MRLRVPKRTVRLKLTLLYGGLFLVSGAALLAITYVLVVHASQGIYFKGENGQGLSMMWEGDDRMVPDDPMSRQAIEQHDRELRSLLTQSGIALGIMSVFSILLGWYVAGRVLRPLRTITGKVKNITATNLNERLALQGPDDELRELGDTFDGLLARLDGSFEAQKAFVANASHELRTPLARQRTLAQVALTDPEATADTLRHAHERVLDAGSQQEQLIEALLTLARGQAGLDARERLDLAGIVADVVRTREPIASEHELRLGSRIEDAQVHGDRRLVEQLVVNLVDNAIRHNRRGGWIEVSCGTREGDGRAFLTVDNSGQVVPASEVERLFEPFHRIGADRTAQQGHGLGLSIVEAIARAHGAEVSLYAHRRGGLEVRVLF